MQELLTSSCNPHKSTFSGLETTLLSIHNLMERAGADCTLGSQLTMGLRWDWRPPFACGGKKLEMIQGGWQSNYRTPTFPLENQ